MDKFVAMRSFVEIADQGSLTKAGEALGKSLPTMVRTLALLEESLGVRLIVRTTRRMALSPEGQHYLERARRILADVDEAEEILAEGQSEPKGELKVTAPVLFGQMHVAPALIRLVEKYPRLSVDLVLLDRIVDLVEEGVDAAIRLATLPDSSMIAIRTGQVRRVVVASPAFLERTGIPEEPKMLGLHPCVLFQGIASNDVWTFASEGRELRVRVKGPFRTNQAVPALDACAAGLGFGYFLSYQTEPLIRAGRLVEVLEPFALPGIPVSIVYPSARFVSARLRAFIDFMRDELRATIGSSPSR